ncbi:CoA-binding protein [Camelimonas sp. ID_303_24]
MPGTPPTPYGADADPHAAYPDDLIRSILTGVKSIAIVGASSNTVRPSWIVTNYMAKRGYRVWAVNPGLAGTEIAGCPVVASLRDLPEPVDMVDIFRNSAAAGDIVDEALALPVPPKVIWMQLTVRNDAAAAKAEARGCTVIMDRCPKIEYGRFSGEISWNGVNSRVLSSKRRVNAGGNVQRMTLGAAGPSFRGRG